MTYILERLYLGSMEDASNSAQLRKKGVTHILTVDWKPISREWRESFEYQYISAMDEQEMDLLSRFEECIQFIADGRKIGGVLVHCQAGLSRSATVVIAYIMKTMSLSFTEAFSLVSRQRPQIMPNDGFVEQLRLFELMGNQVDPTSEFCRRYRLQRLAAMMQRTQDPNRTTFQKDALSADPAGSSESEAGVMYKCRKCRRPLFREGVIMCHPVGRGREAFHWKGSTIRHSYDDESSELAACTGTLFTEPIQWMEKSILSVEGKLSCPKCQAKLGSFNWAGERCPCGRWITPSFHILSGKVDKCFPRAMPPTLQPRAGTARREEDRDSAREKRDVDMTTVLDVTGQSSSGT
ncbi:Dual specificity protein phosphatase 12 [Lamellibrachia satsuma]|nr:Dual specificity protein phosphatase 12 [Lamellibrachia satsuma]